MLLFLILVAEKGLRGKGGKKGREKRLSGKIKARILQKKGFPQKKKRYLSVASGIRGGGGGGTIVRKKAPPRILLGGRGVSRHWPQKERRKIPIRKKMHLKGGKRGLCQGGKQ